MSPKKYNPKYAVSNLGVTLKNLILLFVAFLFSNSLTYAGPWDKAQFEESLEIETFYIYRINEEQMFVDAIRFRELGTRSAIIRSLPATQEQISVMKGNVGNLATLEVYSAIAIDQRQYDNFLFQEYLPKMKEYSDFKILGFSPTPEHLRK